MRIAHEHRGPLLLGVVCTYFMLLAWMMPTDANDTRDSVHQRMQQILNEEVPADVTRISFDAIGVRQDCILSNKGHDESVAVPNAPHQAHIIGQITRNGEGWRSIDPNGASRWVKSFQANQLRVDAAAISEPDFRTLIRQCVAAVRLQRHQASTWTLTEDENRASWSAWSDAK